MNPPVAVTTEAEERFELWRRRVGIVLAPIVFFAFWHMPLGLPEKAHHLAAVFGFTIVLWLTEAIPMAAASLLGAVLIVVMQIAPMDKTFASFGHPIIFLFLGGFLLAEAMKKHGLDRRIALTLMSLPGVASSPGRILAALGGITAFLSMWMSNTAITAVMLPIVTGVLRAHPDLRNERNLGSALVLMVAFAASVGGLATPVGTPTNLVALGQLKEFGLPRPSFAEWMKMGVPLAAVLMVSLWVMLRGRAKVNVAVLGEEFRRQRSLLPKLSLGEINTSIAFTLAVSLWLVPGVCEAFGCKLDWLNAHMPEEAVALIAALLLFILPTKDGTTLTWDDAKHVDWGTLLLFGGGFALGQQIKETGLSTEFGKSVAAWLNNPSEGTLIAIAILVAVMLSEATSNTTSANVMVPIMIGIAKSTGADPIKVATATCLACSLGFMLPISTPPNALAYGTGLVKIPTMAKYGIMLDVAGGVAIWIGVRWLL